MHRTRNFPGGSRPACQKTALTTFVFFFVLFFSLQLILQFHSGLSMVYFKENYTFPRFQRGSNFFQGGVKMLISIETHRTYDSPGGGLDPLSPSGSVYGLEAD